MTILERPMPAGLDHARHPAIQVGATLLALLAAGLTGVALGVADLYALSRLHSPWPDLLNTCAFWALAAFALGAVVANLLHVGPVRSALAGAVALSIAVCVYYLWASAFQVTGRQALGSEHAQTWLAAGIASGAVFGTAGAWTSGTVWWQRVAGVATGCGVLVGEALHLRQNGSTNQATELMVLLALVALLATARSPRVLLPAALLTWPAAVFWAWVLATAGIQY